MRGLSASGLERPARKSRYHGRMNELAVLVSDFADGLAATDAAGVRHKNFRPGIGPFGEPQAVREALARMKVEHRERYLHAEPKRTPDLLVPDAWAVECKLLRPFGDNGEPAEHWSENVLHPYAGNTSALGDCLKLLDSVLHERKAVVVFGFEHEKPRLPLDPAMRGFELLAAQLLGLKLGPRIEERRAGLVHPVHQVLLVFGFEVLGVA